MWWFQFRNRRCVSWASAGLAPSGASARASDQMLNLELARDMEPASSDGMPTDVLIVEDDPIIALDFEDTVLGFGVKTVRTAGERGQSARYDRRPAAGFRAARCQPHSRKSFARRRTAGGAQDSVCLRHRLRRRRSVLPAAFAAKPRLPKPYSTDALQALLKSGCVRP